MCINIFFLFSIANLCADYIYIVRHLIFRHIETLFKIQIHKKKAKAQSQHVKTTANKGARDVFGRFHLASPARPGMIDKQA